jgi:DNA polymerase alpha subunit A
MEKPVRTEHPQVQAVTNSFIAKRKREEEKAKKENMDKGISNYFTKGPAPAQTKAKVCSMEVSDVYSAN